MNESEQEKLNPPHNKMKNTPSTNKPKRPHKKPVPKPNPKKIHIKRRTVSTTTTKRFKIVEDLPTKNKQNSYNQIVNRVSMHDKYAGTGKESLVFRISDRIWRLMNREINTECLKNGQLADIIKNKSVLKNNQPTTDASKNNPTVKKGQLNEDIKNVPVTKNSPLPNVTVKNNPEVKFYPSSKLEKIKFWDPQKSDTNEASHSKSEDSHNIYEDIKSKPTLKRRVRRQLWQWSKNAIKSNPHYSKLFEDSHINIDNVNIDEVNLDIIDVDALGIENKWLKRTVVWLLK